MTIGTPLKKTLKEAVAYAAVALEESLRRGELYADAKEIIVTLQDFLTHDADFFQRIYNCGCACNDCLYGDDPEAWAKAPLDN